MSGGELKTQGASELPILKCIEPHARINTKKEYVVLDGIEETLWQQFPANGSVTGSTAPSSLSFTCNPPSPSTLINRIVYMKWYVQVAVTVSGGTVTPIFQPEYDSFREFPINSCINTTAVQVNGTTISIDTNDTIHALLRLNSYGRNADINYSLCPSMLDQYQTYSDWEIYGSARNPMALFGENSAQQPRGGFPYTIITNTGTAMTIQAEIVEPIFLSPFLSESNHAGFIGVQNMNFVFTLGNLSRMWSHGVASNNPITFDAAPVVTFYAQPQLCFQYFQPNPLVAAQILNKPYVYPYCELQQYINPQGNLNSSTASGLVTCNNLQLRSIPKRLLVYVQRTNSDRTYLTTDTFAAITHLEVQWGTRSSLVSSANRQDLFQMAVKNGYMGSWASWIQYSGSVAVLEFGSDIGLFPGEAPGLRGTYQLVVKVNYTNPSSSTINYDVRVVTISEGSYTIFNNRVVPEIGIFSKEDVLNAPLANIPYSNMTRCNPYGGDFFGILKGIAESVLPFVPAGNLVKAGLNLLPGYKGKGIYGDALSGGKKKKLSKKKLSINPRRLGRGVSGGKIMDRKEIENSLSEYDSD